MLFTTNGRKIHFDLLGRDDDPVIYLAHSLAADSGMWSEQVPTLLAAGYRVLRVDIRGHGGSDPAPGSYSMEQLAADAVLVLDHLRIGDAHFCGLSIGGMIAQGVALLHPERVTSLILCDTRSASPLDALRRWGPRIAEVQAHNSMIPLADATMARWLSAGCRAANPDLWQRIRDTVAATSPQGYIGCAAAIQNFTWTERLHEISAPTLVLCGTDDPGSDLEENRQIARLVQNGRFLAIEGAFHLPNVEDPGRFNRILIDWCNTPQPFADNVSPPLDRAEGLLAARAPGQR